MHCPLLPNSFPGLEVSDYRSGDVLAAIAAAVEDGLDHLLVLPGETAEENRDVVALRPGEGSLHRLFELAHAGQAGFCAKPRTLGIDTSLDFHFEVCLNDLFSYRHLRLLWGRRFQFGCARILAVIEPSADYIWPFIPWNPCASLLEEVLDHTLIVVAPAKNVVQRGEAVSLAGLFLVIKLLGFEFMIADDAPVVARRVHGKARREGSVDADDHGVLSGAAVPWEVIALHEIDHLPEPRVRVHHLVAGILLFGQPLDGFFHRRPVILGDVGDIVRPRA